VSADPVQPDDEINESMDGEMPEALDENLAALARAEAEMEALGARLSAGDGSLPHDTVVARQLAERRRRGHPVWGRISLFLAMVGVVWPLVSGAWAEFLKRPGLRWDRGQIIEAAILSAAIVLGTIGRRRTAGRRAAFVGRLVSLCIPPAAWLLLAAMRTYRGVSDGDLVIASAGALVWLACGLFAFATFDALLEP
jgi:hypothetical protein